MSKPILIKQKIEPDTLSNIIHAFELSVIECGEIITDTNESHGEIFQHFFRLNYIVEGKAYYKYENRTIELEPGAVVFLEPGVTLSVDEGKPVKIIFINFEMNALDKRDDFIKSMSKIFLFQHIHDDDKSVITIMKIIYNLAKENKPGTWLEIQNNFQNLFIRIFRYNENRHHELIIKPVKRADDIYNSAIKYIGTNIDKNFKLTDISKSLNISDNYLYKIFVSKTGKSPSTFITELKMNFAKSYLENPNLQIKSIALNLGYDTVAHFSQTFKKVEGVSPAAYRKKKINQLKDKKEKEAVIHGAK